MDILALKLRSDFSQFLKQVKSDQVVYWRRVKQALIAISVVLILFSLVPIQKPLGSWLGFFIYSPLVLIFAIQPTIHILKRRRIAFILLVIIFSLISFMASALNPFLFTTEKYPTWALVVMLLLPIIMWLVLSFYYMLIPSEARRSGMGIRGGGFNLVLGLLIGCLVSGHFLFIIRYIPNIGYAEIPGDPSVLIYLFGTVLGVVIPSQELLFRGTGFSILHDSEQKPFLPVYREIAFLELLLISAVLLVAGAPYSLILINIPYRLAITFINLVFFRKQRTLLLPIVVNLIYSIVFGLVL